MDFATNYLTIVVGFPLFIGYVGFAPMILASAWRTHLEDRERAERWAAEFAS